MPWTEIIAIEPRLKDLYDEARAVKDDRKKDSFCANMVWHRQFKPRVRQLAGYFAEKPELRTEQAYELATVKIYRPLPGCRNCACL